MNPKFKSINVILFQTGENAAAATEVINSAWGDNFFGASTVRKWFSRFRVGNFNL